MNINKIQFKMTKIKLFCSLYWRNFFLIFAPIIFLPVILIDYNQANCCLYVLLIMAIYWITEALPLGITGIIPVFMFPTLSIMDTHAVTINYMKETVMMFVGTIIVALAVEFSGIHIRVALKFMQIVGCTHIRLHFGLMFITMFVSMWTSNTASVAMMCPVISAIIGELEEQGLCSMYKQNNDKSDPNDPPEPTNLTMCYYFGAAYAASIGGVGTLVGTGSNLTLKGIYEEMFPHSPGVEFVPFMLYNMPVSIICTLATCFYLQFLFLGLFRPSSQAAKESTLDAAGKELTTKIINDKYKELGPLNMHELSVGILFILAVFLWFFMKPGFMPGYAESMTNLKVNTATPTMFIVFLLFVLPAQYEFLNFFKKDNVELPKKPSTGLITWKFVNDKMPWSLVFLLGGGFALADGGKASGMSAMIGNSLVGLQVLPPFIILFVVLIACQIFTEFTANVATANILLPVLGEMARAIKINPLYLMLPAGITCSFSFLLPVGTPPNAIVAGLVNIPTKDFLIAGIGPSIITLLYVWLSFPTLGALIYPGLLDFPEWANYTKKN